MQEAQRPGRPASFDARPLPWVAGAVALGGLAGRDASSGGRAVALVVLALVGMVLALRPLRRRLRRWGVPVWLGILLGLAYARALVLPPSAPTRADTPAALERAREDPVVGRWRSLGRARGWLEADDGKTSAAHGLLYETSGPPPDDGERVVVLSGGQVVRWPAGPVPGPRARAGRFLALAPLRADELVRLGKSGGAPPGARLRSSTARARRALAERAGRLERDDETRGLAAALVAGVRSGLPAELSDLFTRTGTRHLLALSGLHVGLLTVLLLLPITSVLLRLPWPRAPGERRALVLGCRLLLLGAYALVVGLGDPVTRASAAVALVLVAPALPAPGTAAGDRGRAVDPLSVWSFALLVEGVVDPAGLSSLSLSLSYVATLGILVGTGPLRHRLLPRAAADPVELVALSPVTRLVRTLARRAAELGAGALAASLAAVLATLPLVWGTFGEWSPVGIIATPLTLVPLALLLGTLWVGVLLPAAPLTPVVDHLEELLITLLAAADGVPGTPCPLPPRPAALLWVLVAASFAALVAARRRPMTNTRPRATQRFVRATLAGWGLVLLPWSAAPSGLELHALDVGHGSSFVLRAPGLPALVFDAGSRDRPEIYSEALAPLLAAWEVRRPWVALSHDHTDHRSALDRLVERYPPAVWLGVPPRRLAERLPRSTAVVQPVIGRVAIGPGGGLRGGLSLAWVRGSPSTGNEGSGSLEIGWRGARLLLTGDAEGEGLGRALDEGWMRGPVRLLSFPHHGSDTPLAGELLRRLRPAEVWISAAAEPAIGPELDRRRLPWRWTGRDGSLALFLP